MCEGPHGKGSSPFELMSEKQDRDVERVYSTSEFVSKLRRLAAPLERAKRFEIQVAGERVYVLARAEFNVAHEREGNQGASVFSKPRRRYPR